MVGPDTSLSGSLVAAGVLLAWHQVIVRVRRASPAVAKLLTGAGMMLINNGAVIDRRLRQDHAQPLTPAPAASLPPG